MSDNKELLQEMKTIRDHHYRSRTAYNYYYSRYDKLYTQLKQHILEAHPIEEQLKEVEPQAESRTKYQILADYHAEEKKPIRSFGAAHLRKKKLADLERELQIVLLEEFLAEADAKLG